MIVYAIHHRESGKKYIGITRGLLSKRIQEHLRQRTMLISRALRAYGLDAFDIDVIDTAICWDDLCAKEVYWIAKLNSISPNGYNLSAGGEGILDSTGDISRRRISTRKRNGNPWISEEQKARIAISKLGTKASPEHRASLTASLMGNQRRKGTHHSEATRERISIAVSAAKIGHRRSLETMAKIRATRAKHLSEREARNG
jgi:group I intron endonuclease